LNKIVSTKKISAIFLAIVLIGGTIFTFSSSFIRGAQAELDYGLDSDKDNNSYKSKDSSNVIVKKIKCNNINANLNGFNGLKLNALPTSFNALATNEAKAANEGEIGASFSGSGERNTNGYQHNDKDFRFVCINNNNFEVVETSPEPLTCEECFTENPLTLMTWNIYQGADLSPIFSTTTTPEFVAAVGAAYNRIQATNFVERADSIADEIQETRPDLIGLQEVILLRTQTPSDGPATPATNVSFDYLQILIDNLAQRGLIYEPIIVQTGTDIEVPGLLSTGIVDIRLTDRDVILARADRDFTLSNLNGAQFAATLPVPTPFGSVNLPHSWVSVDITFDKGDKARLVSTHLEPLSPVIQGLQAEELLNGPGNTDLPVIFIGDYNSNADGTGTPTYTKLTDAGFIDAWSIKGIGSGFTCCQAADLLNQDSLLTERIDLVMFRGNFEVKDIGLVGNSQNDRTRSDNLWPSDHAGVVANLKLNSDKD
jgi:endonuclease/exonuclease/phosphatase family metal-dependent hydrolase